MWSNHRTAAKGGSRDAPSPSCLWVSLVRSTPRWRDPRCRLPGSRIKHVENSTRVRVFCMLVGPSCSYNTISSSWTSIKSSNTCLGSWSSAVEAIICFLGLSHVSQKARPTVSSRLSILYAAAAAPAKADLPTLRLVVMCPFGGVLSRGHLTFLPWSRMCRMLQRLFLFIPPPQFLDDLPLLPL